MFDDNIHIIYYLRTDPTSAIASPCLYGFVDIHGISHGSSNTVKGAGEKRIPRFPQELYII